MKKLIPILIVILFYSLSFTQEEVESNRLFIIERSKNANIVCYDAKLDKDGQIDKENPVDAYWFLYAEKYPQREELSLFDKKAYGFKTSYNETIKECNFKLKAVENKNMTILIANGNPKVKIMINNTDSYLNKVFIKSKDGAFGIPKVYFYVLYGTSIATNENTEEKIILQK